MIKSNYKQIVFFISVTILITIMAQVYWNIKEYERHKQNLINRVQLSLDNSVEAYYANLTKSGIITYSSTQGKKTRQITDTVVVKTSSRWEFRKKMDSTLQIIAKKENKKPLLVKNPGNNFPLFTADRSIPKNIDSLISKVFISITRDTLNIKRLDSLVFNEFKRNNVQIKYALKFTNNHRYGSDTNNPEVTSLNLDNFPKNRLTTVSKSTFLPHDSELKLFFTTNVKDLLRDSLISLLLSFILSASIIGSLIYLLRTLFKQKQLAEVKNDLISNITHEFKTPIATISTALEAMKSFNALNDKAKSEKYIAMATEQVDKLGFMVEKILETATLNHESLTIKKEPVNVAELISKTIEKYKLLNTKNSFKFDPKNTSIFLNLDVFHFENAIGNILDNAIKYGGPIITVELKTTKSATIITLKDNGVGIEKNQKEKVFDQFYRIPTGNTHNVKGFGIGLYYTKKIIEKHQGTIEIIYDSNNQTIFQLTLPNE